MSLYVYAITKTSHPLRLDALTGVGEAPAELRTVRGDSLCAVVSETPEDLSVGRRDLQAHHEVQERLWADGATLPLSFGFVAQDEDAVRAVLREQAEHFARGLDEVTGRVEYNVKAVPDEDALLRRILDESERVRELNEATRGGSGSYDDRVALGQLVREEVRARQEALAAEALTALRPLAYAEQLSPPSPQYALNVSFLVDEGRSEEFAGVCRELAERYGEAVEVRVRGPLPPYSFVGPPQPGVQG